MFQKSGVGKIEVIRKNYSKKDFQLLFGLVWIISKKVFSYHEF